MKTSRSTGLRPMMVSGMKKARVGTISKKAKAGGSPRPYRFTSIICAAQRSTPHVQHPAIQQNPAQISSTRRLTFGTWERRTPRL